MSKNDEKSEILGKKCNFIKKLYFRENVKGLWKKNRWNNQNFDWMWKNYENSKFIEII